MNKGLCMRIMAAFTAFILITASFGMNLPVMAEEDPEVYIEDPEVLNSASEDGAETGTEPDDNADPEDVDPSGEKAMPLGEPASSDLNTSGITNSEPSENQTDSDSAPEDYSDNHKNHETEDKSETEASAESITDTENETETPAETVMDAGLKPESEEVLLLEETFEEEDLEEEDSEEDVYSFSIHCGPMQFKYEYAGQWDAASHSYVGGSASQSGWDMSCLDGENNKIEIENESSVPVTVSLTYNGGCLGNVTGIFRDNQDDLRSAVLNDDTSGTSGEWVIDAQSTGIYYFSLSGSPESDADFDTMTSIGAIDVSVTPIEEMDAPDVRTEDEDISVTSSEDEDTSVTSTEDVDTLDALTENKDVSDTPTETTAVSATQQDEDEAE